MKNPGKSSTLALLVVMLILSAFGCQSKKKAMEASYLAGEKARMEQEAAAQKERDAESARKEAEAEAQRKAEAARANEPADVAINTRVNNYFEATAQASTVAAANATIADALTLFASPETPVLIVISEEGGQKDYDRPTTIRDYLNYIKDQKKNSNRISNVKMDSAGKITEVEVRKPL